MRRQIAYCMDCMDFMKLLPDKAFDLAIVDPPYGIGAGGGKQEAVAEQSVKIIKFIPERTGQARKKFILMN